MICYCMISELHWHRQKTGFGKIRVEVHAYGLSIPKLLKLRLGPFHRGLLVDAYMHDAPAQRPEGRRARGDVRCGGVG